MLPSAWAAVGRCCPLGASCAGPADTGLPGWRAAAAGGSVVGVCRGPARSRGVWHMLFRRSLLSSLPSGVPGGLFE